MKYLSIIPFLFLLVIFFTSCNHGGTGSAKYADSLNSNKQDSAILSVSKPVSEFMVNAAGADIIEIEFGELAQKQANNNKVREFAKMMVTDHTAADNQLKEMAIKGNVTLPDSLSEESKNELERMSHLKGIDLDKAYIKKMYEDNQKMIFYFKNELTSVTQPDLKQWITHNILLMKNHLDSARSLSKILGITPKNISGTTAP